MHVPYVYIGQEEGNACKYINAKIAIFNHNYQKKIDYFKDPGLVTFVTSVTYM